MKRQADAVLAVAGAELRVAWRSVRLWVGVLTLAGLTVGLFGFYAYVHAANPVSLLASATLAPRFLIAHLGAYPLAFALVLVVALLYDAETRDERAGIADALNARPVSNEALCAGRLLGAALCGWGALAFALALAQGLGLAARGANWWMGDAIEPVSLAAFAFLDAPPAIALMAALTLFLAAALRRRAFVMAAASILLLGALGGSHLLPARLYDALLPIFDAAGFASDLAPRFHDPSSLAQRGAMLLATAGLAFAAAGLSPRLPQRHGKRRRSLIIGIAFFSAGALALAMVGFAAGRDGKQRQEWLAEHRAAAAHAAAIRLRQVRGGVRINPGVELSLELELQVEALAQTDELVFSFNPGMRIENLDADGLASFTHRQGLLDVRLAERLRAGERHALTIRAAGVPAAGFAYLDSVLDRRRVQHGNRLWRLGGEASLFDANYVALMPGVRWLPTPGANLETNGQRGAFEVDLTVGAPCGWRVAGPGRPRPVESPSPSGEETGCPAFAFRPGAPVSNFALFASRFERRAAMFGDVEVALLASRDHMPHLERLAGDGAELTAEIEALFAAARQAGIPYPYDGLTVVEVPMRLRAYGGGWRLAAAFDLPGVLPIREAVALARFERRLALFGGLSGDASAARRRMLREWGRSDRHGGDLARGFAFNAFGAVANAASAGDAETFQHLAYGLLILPPYLAHHLPTNPFSAHVLNVQAPFGAWAGEMATDVLGMRNVSAQSNPRVDGPDVWERAATLSLATPKVARQDAVEAARAAAAMALKAGKTAGAILDTLGHARAAALLAQLRRRFAGEPIPADWAAELEALPSDLAAVVDDWLHGKALPGIVASTARFSRFAAPGGPERHRARLRLSTAARSGRSPSSAKIRSR